MRKKLLCALFIMGILSIFSQEKVSIAWDTSLSMQERTLDKEFEFLDKYFAKYQNTQARVLLFNGIQAKSEDFQITEGNWDAVKKVLKNAVYDGPSGYHTLTNVFANGTTLLFTDGIENIEQDIPNLGKALYVINSNVHNHIQNLQFLALSNKGRFINIAPAEKPIQENIASIIYAGTVYGDDVAPETVSVAIKGSGTKMTPEPDGTFKVEAKPGDVLVVEVPGLSPVEKTMTEDRNINVWIRNEGIQLSQVFLKNEKTEEEEEKVNIGYNRVDKKSLGYAVQTVSAEDMNTDIGTLSGALNGKISGVGDGYNREISLAKIRQANFILAANHPLILIDGVPIPRAISGRGPTTKVITNFIDVNNIADITVLKGFAATNQYGTQGSGGVILIKTKGSAAIEAAEDRREKEETKNVTNLYQGTVKAPPKYSKAYLSALALEPSVNSAYKLYQKQRYTQTDSPTYYIDAFDFFATRNQNMAKNIGYNILENHSEDFGALRSLLFKAEEKKFFEMELNIAKAMVQKHPNRVQVYLDLAKAQKHNGNYQAALDVLLAITKGTANPSLDFTPIEKTAHQEIRNLIADHKEGLELSKIEVSHLKKEPLDARIVFDWSDWDADFELTFINPKKEFVTWKHTSENQERLLDEQIKGYSQEEFEISGGDKGVWLVNAKYLGNRIEGNESPVFLRCLVQYDYGTANERSEEYVLRLFEKGSEQLAVRVATQ